MEVVFTSYAASTRGSQYLQFATLEQTEVFTLTDRATIFWGTVELPDVIVSATAPVEYTAYLDFEDRWDFRLEQNRILVIAPPIRFNKPSIDASQIHYEVRQDSLLRDEGAVLEALRIGLTEMSIRRAWDHIADVREIGRLQTEQFVSNWLVQAFADGTEYEVEVRFADETELPASFTDNQELP
jgi:hypothetical protein